MERRLADESHGPAALDDKYGSGQGAAPAMSEQEELSGEAGKPSPPRSRCPARAAAAGRGALILSPFIQ